MIAADSSFYPLESFLNQVVDDGDLQKECNYLKKKETSR